MLKNIALILLSILFANVAHAECSYRYAYVMEAVVQSVDVSRSSCQIYLKDGFTLKQDPRCPIDENLLKKQEIQTSLHREDVCAFEVGEEVLGIIIQENGSFELKPQY